MTLTAIDHVVVATRDLEEAAEPWRRLGLNPVYGTRHPGQGTENAVVFLGDSPETMFYVEFLSVHDPAAAAASPRGRLLMAAIETGGGLFRVVLEADDLDGVRTAAARGGITIETADIRRDDGSKIGDVLAFRGDRETSNDPRVIQYAAAREARHASRRERGVFRATFDLVRLDHLALVPDGLDETTSFWTDILGVPVHGEVRGPGMLIRQMRVGDAIVEFLAATSPDSRLAGAAPGLRSMIACEVDDLAAAVESARERGFTPSEPATGILPGTRTATIPPAELSGVALQLLEYV